MTFYSPVDGTHLIKRLVALPGDVVEMRDDRLTINGVPADYVARTSSREALPGGAVLDAQQWTERWGEASHAIQLMPALAARRDMAPVVIPPGHYLMLGDNRDNSADSRYIGLIARNLLIGRAERVLVSADMLGNWRPRLDRFGLALSH